MPMSSERAAGATWSALPTGPRRGGGPALERNSRCGGLCSRAEGHEVVAGHRHTEVSLEARVVGDEIALEALAPPRIEARRQRLGRPIALDEELPDGLGPMLAPS